MEVAEVFGTGNAFKVREAAAKAVEACAALIGGGEGFFGGGPQLVANHGRGDSLFNVFEKVAHFGEVGEAKTVHGLDETATYAVMAQEGGDTDCFVICGGEHAYAAVVEGVCL